MIALVTGYAAFDFDLKMKISLRDGLFAAHRLSGLLAAILLLYWGILRIRTIIRIPRITLKTGITLVHIGLWSVCIAIPVAPWIARSLGGRTNELYLLFPQANLVSHPTGQLTYKLLQLHKDLVDVAIVLLVIHITAAFFHGFYLKDNQLRSMMFRN